MFTIQGFFFILLKSSDCVATIQGWHLFKELLTLGAHAHDGYSTPFVCLYVCMSSLAHLAAKSLKFGHR